MKKVWGGLGLMTLLAFSSVAAFGFSNNATTPKRALQPSRYDVSKEVTIEGTIQSVVKKPTAGMMLGEHLMLSTSKGTVDAHVGGYVMAHPGLLPVSIGQSVKVVGVMTTINHREVFLVRTVEAGARTTQVRNIHGFLLRPGAKDRVAQTSLKEGAR